MILDELGAYLASQGIGVLEQTLFLSGLVLDPDFTGSPDAIMALIEVPGLPMMLAHPSVALGTPLTLNDVPGYEQPMLQVLTRGRPYAYEECRTRARQAFFALGALTNVELSGVQYLWVRAMQPPYVLRQGDSQHRPYIAFTVWAAKEVS